MATGFHAPSGSLAKEIRVLTNAGVPTNGTTGTYAGVAAIAQLLVDTTNKQLYINTGTTASPTWAEIAHA